MILHVDKMTDMFNTPLLSVTLQAVPSFWCLIKRYKLNAETFILGKGKYKIQWLILKFKF